MKPLHRVKLSLFLMLVLLLFWSWISGVFQTTEVKGVFVEWPEYAHRHLEESLPVAGDFVVPIDASVAGRSYLYRSFGEEDSTAEIWKLEPESPAHRMPVVAMGDGLVLMSEKWGSDLNGVVVLLHRTGDPKRILMESMCAGLDILEVSAGQRVRKGERLGLILNAKENGLQWEVRDELGLGVGPGSSEDLRGWIRPGSILNNPRGSTVAK